MINGVFGNIERRFHSNLPLIFHSEVDEQESLDVE